MEKWSPDLGATPQGTASRIVQRHGVRIHPRRRDERLCIANARPSRAVPARRTARAKQLAHARKTTRLPCGLPSLQMPIGIVRKAPRRASCSDTAFEIIQEAHSNAVALRMGPVPCRASTPNGPGRATERYWRSSSVGLSDDWPTAASDMGRAERNEPKGRGRWLPWGVGQVWPARQPFARTGEAVVRCGR